jgi:hypothetical protein
MRLVRSSSGSVLYMPNGNKYNFPATNQHADDEGVIQYYANNMVDVDGNKTVFTESNVQGDYFFTKTDTLGRSLTDPIQHNFGKYDLRDGPKERKEDFIIPSLEGGEQKYTQEWRHLKPRSLSARSNGKLRKTERCVRNPD